MFASRTYFSLSVIASPERHLDHNLWHQLDHRPENLLLLGVAWGDRWVRSPDCAGMSHGSNAAYLAAHYGIMYWFREPLRETLDDWFHLTHRSFQWGRSSQVGWTERPMRGFFSPVKGYVAPRAFVSIEALPYRPVKAVHVTLSRVEHTHKDAAEILRWYDRERLPDLLACRGVAGGWVLAEDASFQARWEEGGPQWPFADQATRSGIATPNRMQILYLDEEPADVLADIEARDRELKKQGRLRDTSAVEDVMFASPLRAITAWEWDWFTSMRM
jgi:hypothetical protein